MAATFDPTLADAVSRIRQMIGDTKVIPETKAEVQDETITAILAQKEGDETAAAARLCWDISAKYARMADTELDNQEIKYSQVSKRYEDLAKRLESSGGKPVGAGGTTGGIIVTGLDDCRGPDLGYVYPYGCWP